MPKMNGFKLMQILKTQTLTSHIPIILLTAKAGEENQIKGYAGGADAYITKPFEPKMLHTRMQTILKNKQILKNYYSGDLEANPEIVITSTEKIFLKSLQSILDENLTDAELTAEKFSQLMGMSRTNLHRKLKAVTQMSTTEFIRHHRLKVSKQILTKSDATISEIAYQLGFNTPSYFTKCFKKAFQCSPEQFRASA